MSDKDFWTRAVRGWKVRLAISWSLTIITGFATVAHLVTQRWSLAFVFALGTAAFASSIALAKQSLRFATQCLNDAAPLTPSGGPTT